MILNDARPEPVDLRRRMPETRGGPSASEPIDGWRGDLEFGTIPALLRLVATRYANSPAIVDGGTTLTYASLARAAAVASRSLLALGVVKGDRVAIWAPNSWEWIVAALATHLAGGTLVPVNTRFKGEEAADIVGRSRARVLFTVGEFLGFNYAEAALRVRPALGTLERIVTMRGAEPRDTLGWAAFLRRSERVTEEAALARSAAVSPDDLSDILFTSGTTGKPKGVMATHAQTLRAFRDWGQIVGLRAEDRYLVVLPFFHSFGYKAGWLASLMAGATVYPQSVFDVDTVLANVDRWKITVLPGPPTLYQAILAHPMRHKYALSSLRLAVTGAAAVPVELIYRMRRELTFETIVTGYGLTEATGVSTLCRPEDDADTVATTSGRAVGGVDVLVLGDDGLELPRGETGEVAVRGYSVMEGYLDDPTATREAIDARGLLRTGDIGVMDARGYLRLTDRKKDMFIVGGFNAYPAEIENVIARHEVVVQVAVVGEPDARLGETGVAFVVRRPGFVLTDAELIAWCRDRMANYKVPRRVAFVDQLPLNASGKVLKQELRERARGGG